MLGFSIAGLVRGVHGVGEFNSLLGNLENVDNTKLLAQARICVEEAGEALQVIEENTKPQEILKETIDLLVTAHGLAQMLITQGYDVEGAWKAVNENNMTKFCHSLTDAAHSRIGYEATGVHVDVVVRDNVLALIDENGKLRKPIAYQKVDVSKYCPKNNKEETV